MRIDVLLKKLINISGMSKTDFAFETNYSPSAISKILNNLQLPSGALLRNFFDLASRCLGRDIYRKDPTAIQDVFPISYDFESELEIVEFIRTALKQSYLITTKLTGEEYFDLYNSHAVWEQSRILNYLCVGLSFVLNQSEEDVEVYSTIELLGDFENNMLKKLKFNGDPKQKKVIVNQLISRESIDKADISKVFAKYNGLLKNFEVRTYLVDKMPKNEVMFVPKYYIAIYNFISEGIPQIQFIDDLPYLVSIKQSILKHFHTRISHEGEELHKAFTDISNHNLADEFRYMFCYMPMALIFDDDFISLKTDKADLLENMRNLMKGMTRTNLLFVLSRNAFMKMLSTGKCKYPILGNVDIPAEKRGDFIDRYTKAFASGDNRLMLSRNEYENIFCCGTDDYLYIYTPDNGINKEKIVIIPGKFTASSYAAELNNAYEVGKDEWEGIVDSFMRDNIAMMSRDIR